MNGRHEERGPKLEQTDKDQVLTKLRLGPKFLFSDRYSTPETSKEYRRIRTEIVQSIYPKQAIDGPGII